MKVYRSEAIVPEKHSPTETIAQYDTSFPEMPVYRRGGEDVKNTWLKYPKIIFRVRFLPFSRPSIKRQATDRRIDGMMDGLIDGLTDRWIDGLMDRWIDGLMRSTDRWID